VSDLYGVAASRRRTDTLPRCRTCGKLLAEFVTRPWRMTCRHCKAVNGSTAVTSTAYPDDRNPG
jgi:phage FluMu protein Com